MALGDFIASHLPDMMSPMDQVFTGDRHKQGIVKPVDTANAILGRQLVDWEVFYGKQGLDNGNSCIGAKVIWLKDCDDTVEDCPVVNDCNISGPEIESDNQLYAPNLCFQKTGSVLDKECKDYFDKAQKLGKKMGNVIASLDQELQARLIAFLLANGQYNRYENTYGTRHEVGVDGDNNTTFANTYWTPEIIAEFIATAEANDFYNYYALSGKNLWNAYFTSQYKENCCNTDKLLTAGPLDLFFDLRNIDIANGNTPTTMLVDAGCLGYFNATDYKNESPRDFSHGSDLVVYRVPSRRLKYNNGGTMMSIYYDIEIQEECKVNPVTNKKYVQTNILGKHQGGLHLAPPTCNADDTGILIFENECSNC